ncbi:MAG: hypothetical protein VCC00_03175 [Deltaproteobacteria bacterium]
MNWLSIVIGAGLLVGFRRASSELVPLLRFAVSIALVAQIGADLAGASSYVGSALFVVATLAWLLALRVPSPVVLLRGDVPFPGSIKMMLAVPFLLWPALAAFLLAPEMPQGQGEAAISGMLFAVLGAAAVSRLGRVGPRSFAVVLAGVSLAGVGWTLAAFDVGVFAFDGGPLAALLIALAGRALLVVGLLAHDGPRITAEALALAAAEGAEASAPSAA